MFTLRGKRAIRAGSLALAFTCSLASSALAASSQPYADAVLADRPESYLRLDEAVPTGTAADAARPGASTSTLNGGGGALTVVPGAMGDSTAMHFSPAAGGTVRWGVPALATTANGQFTVEAWVRLADFTGSERIFLQFGSSSFPTLKLGHYSVSLSYNLALGAIPQYGRFSRTSYNLSGGTNSMWFGGYFDYPRNWTHVVVTRDNDGVYREYVNGVPTPRTPLSYQLRSAAGATIGTDASASSSARFDGDVDEVAYYPTALSQTQIEAHYQAAIAVGLNQPPAPVNNSLPTVSANTPDYEVGQRLKAEPGGWNTYDVAYRYRWQRCDANGAACTPVSGNEGATEYYRPLYSDAGSTMRVTLTASNWSGTTTVDSAPSQVLSAPPAPTYRAAVLADAPSVFSQVEDVDAGMTWRSGIGTSNYLTGLDATGSGTILGANAPSINAPGALADERGLFLQDAARAAYNSISPRVITTHNDWALELWIRPSAFNGWIANVGPAWRLTISPQYETQNGCPGRGSLVWETNVGTRWFGSGSCVDAGVWSHVVLSRDATTTRLFVNGVEAALSSTTTPTVLPAEQLSFGGGSSSTIALKYRGGIDDVSVYSHALTATDVADHYAAAVTDGIN